MAIAERLKAADAPRPLDVEVQIVGHERSPAVRFDPRTTGRARSVWVVLFEQAEGLPTPAPRVDRRGPASGEPQELAEVEMAMTRGPLQRRQDDRGPTIRRPQDRSVPQSRTTTRSFGASDPGRPGRPAALSAHRRPRLCPIAQARRRNGSILISPRRRERRGRGHSYDVVAFEGRAVQVDRSRQALLAREGGRERQLVQLGRPDRASRDRVPRRDPEVEGVLARSGPRRGLPGRWLACRWFVSADDVRLRRPFGRSGLPAVRVGGSCDRPHGRGGPRGDRAPFGVGARQIVEATTRDDLEPDDPAVDATYLSLSWSIDG